MPSKISPVIEPNADLDHEAVVANGGDYYGSYWLFKCPNCGHPVIHDYEHDYFYPDVTNMSPRVSLGSCGDSYPCPMCSSPFVSDDLWNFANAHRSYAAWLLTRAEIGQHGLSHLLRLPTSRLEQQRKEQGEQGGDGDSEPAV